MEWIFKWKTLKHVKCPWFAGFVCIYECFFVWTSYLGSCFYTILTLKVKRRQSCKFYQLSLCWMKIDTTHNICYLMCCYEKQSIIAEFLCLIEYWSFEMNLRICVSSTKSGNRYICSSVDMVWIKSIEKGKCEGDFQLGGKNVEISVVLTGN